MTDPTPTLPALQPGAGAIDLTTMHPHHWSRPDNRWPLDAQFAAELDRRLHELRPAVVVEVGSGSSTLVLARYAARSGARVISLEHDEQWAAQTLANLELWGLADAVEIHLRPLACGAYRAGMGDDPPWYVNDGVPDGVEFVLIDGPPERAGGRAAVLRALWPHLADGAELWLDDADRRGERKALASWAIQYGADLEWASLPFGKNGAFRLRRGGIPTPATVDASDTVVTILTGRRPQRLAELLDSLESQAPGLLESAQVVALHNDGGGTGDERTRDMLQRIGASLIVTPSLYSIGRATSLLEVAGRRSGAKHWLHLEDDWRIGTAGEGWLDQARDLVGRGRFSQIRLRHATERTLTRHMTTGAPFSWVPRDDAVAHLASGGAHLTFNPFLARTGELTPCFPAADERDFMARAHAFGLRDSAQLYPGVFVHTGGGDSLRARVEAKS